MFANKYLLLELDKFEAEFYHLPDFVPYLNSDHKKLKREGFNWDHAVRAMKHLIKEEDCEEYKPYKLFIKKWQYYKDLNKATKAKRWHEAEKIIDRILSIDLLDPSAYLNLGFVFRSKGEYYKAEQSYLKGLDLISHQTPFLAGLAKTYEELGKFEDAIYTWDQILNEGNNREALDKLIQAKVYKMREGSDQEQISQDQRSIQELERAYLEPDANFETLMRKEFQKSYNDIDSLTKLGVRLVHHKLTKLAVKVFERVYQLSQVEAQPKT